MWTSPSCFSNYGIAIYSKEQLTVRRRCLSEARDGCAIEVVAFEWQENFSVVALYKSPKSGYNLEQLFRMLTDVVDTTKKTVIVGDFNVDLKADRHAADARRLREWMEARQFVFRDVGPTTDSAAASAIDQIWSNSPLGDPTQTLDSHYSDHKKLLICLPS